MDSYFELFDVASGNVIETYGREQEAIQALVDVVLLHGPEAIASFALTCVESGRPTLVAMEDELVLRVQRELPQLAPSRS